MARKATGLPLSLYPLRVDADVRAVIDKLKSEHETVNAGLRVRLLGAPVPRLSLELMALIQFEAERLSAEIEKPVTEADIIEMAVVRMCALPVESDRHAVAEAAMEGVTTRPTSGTPTPEKPKARAESVAQRRERETKEHAAALAESGVVARAVGRDDIHYDLDAVAHRGGPLGKVTIETVRPHYEVQPRKVKPLTRPCGTTEAKRRREQG